MRVLPPALALVLLVATLGAAAPPASPAFHYEAAADHRGPLVVGMTFDYGEDNSCRFVMLVSGTSRAVPVLFYEETTYGGATAYSRYTAQAHVGHEGRVVDTRELVSSGGVWSIRSTTTGTFEGVEVYTLVVFDAASWTRPATGYHAPALLDVTCDKPFTVGAFSRGHEAVGFTTDSLRGGTGVSVNQIAGSATLVRGDGLDATFTLPDVAFRASVSSGTAHVEGELRLETPDGAAAWTLRDDEAFALGGGAGDYALTLDYTGVGLHEHLRGVLYASERVESL